ncbi:adhesion protein [Photobacterium jeanii]|uniref:Adhesion protein n=1 Tax=Photobacterium jeanii TaxID=858640 RepID=A0A178KJR6_9GAMM|nr:sugar transferase [Photobacterium jeanii]OAN16812.1 adhesion protein [Photobacterium jeanii]PST88421.1 LPS biosynthesis sugar transferase SypR [Photobacterium jeanii]
MTLLWALLILLTLVIIYHHLIYTSLMVWLGKRHAHSTQPRCAPSTNHHHDAQPQTSLPKISIVMPAHNEAAFIADKLANLLMLDYPADKLTIRICCDGCNDDTVDIIRQWQPQFQQAGIRLTCQAESNNLGKLARLNQLMTEAKQDGELIALSDVSALISIDALQQAVASFQNPNTGAITSCYLLAQACQGEAQYWQWQNQIRYAESQLGSVMGGNGAFYMMRSELFTPLATDTINDDFMLPMMVLKQGYDVLLNPEINSVEIAASSEQQTHQRRQRIGAGNLQQLIRCRFLFSRRHKHLGWIFGSGKGLRTLMPFLLVTYLFICLVLSWQGALFAQGLLLAQLGAYSLASLPLLGIRHPYLDKWHYFVGSYYSSMLGMLRYLGGQFQQGWKHLPPIDDYQSRSTQCFKRVSDISLSVVGLILTLPLWPIIALLIKLDSKGPVFYHQLRVGKVSEHRTELFEVIKFRTMIHNAESQSGAVWASKRDPRITRVGHWLRITRLDELPQFLNVLKGDMALIGPRPERPQLCGDLQNALPFYLERTAGLRPGITGLAQVSQGYDTCLDDVKAKIAWDHAYAAALGSPWQWLKMDLFIIYKTLIVMISKRGQ